MTDRETAEESRGMPDGTGLSRRQLLTGAGAAAAAVGGGKAADNIVVGYGRLGGTNLVEQSLAPLAAADFGPSPFTVEGPGVVIEYDGAKLRVSLPDRTETFGPAEADEAEAAAIDAEHGMVGDPVTQLVADLSAIAAEAFSFEFLALDDFFARGAETAPRPYTVAALRGETRHRPSPAVVREFSGVDPTETRTLVSGLAAGFQRHTRYNFERYVARTIQFNLLFDSVDLDEGFRPPTHFDAMLANGTSPLLCWDFAERSIEAFHAVPPHRQDFPVAGARVDDARHGHVYTGLASVVRDGDDLVVPMTFLDYRNAVLFDDGPLGPFFDDGVGAYDARHRATRIGWDSR